VAWLNSFDDAAAGKEAALAMIRLGVDELHHNADAAALGLFSAVKENAGIHAYGANADQASIAPERIPASAVIDLGRAMLLVAQQVKEGTFTPRVESFGLASGVIKLTRNPMFTDTIPAALARWVDAAEDSIANGTLLVAGVNVP
jgi:basic membrane protein A